MTLDESVAEQVARLLEQGWLPKSKCSSALRQRLAPLLDAGVVTEERSGAGRRLVVHNLEALHVFQQNNFPTCALPPEAGSRVTGVARFRDSKIFGNDTPSSVAVRAWSEEALTKDGQPTQAALATAQHGAFSFLLESDSPYSLHGKCALVENPIVFARFEQLHLPADLVLYGQGRVSGRILDWLARNTVPDFCLLHLPDYDPVGLSEFERLRTRLGARVQLHLPANLEQLFECFSNRALLEGANSQAMLVSLRRAASPAIQQVLELIHRHNAGLEQESLLLTPP